MMTRRRWKIIEEANEAAMRTQQLQEQNEPSFGNSSQENCGDVVSISNQIEHFDESIEIGFSYKKSVPKLAVKWENPSEDDDQPMPIKKEIKVEPVEIIQEELFGDVGSCEEAFEKGELLNKLEELGRRKVTLKAELKSTREMYKITERKLQLGCSEADPTEPERKNHRHRHRHRHRVRYVLVDDLEKAQLLNEMD